MDMAAERLEGTREVSSLALPPQPRQPQHQRWRGQRPKRRAPSSARLDNGEITRHPRSSVKVSSCSAGSSRPIPARSLRLQRNPVGSVLVLLAATILAVPSARPWVGEKMGWGIGAQAQQTQPCAAVSNSSNSGELQQLTVSNDTANLSTMFACEGGEFNVSWSGVVEVYSTIKIGNGTTVRIFGETTTSSGANSSISGGNSSSYSSYSSSSSSSGVDLEFELERLSSDLNLPQGLTSAAVGVFSTLPFGPIFLVDGGELHLESMSVRGGNATNSTANAIVLGGGVSAINSNVSVTGCVFEDNFAEFLGGGIHANLSTLTVKDSVFHGNAAGFQSYAGDEDVDGAGGGIACDKIIMSVDGCLFNDNYASKKGGGVHVGKGQVSVVDSLFFNNLAGSDNVESEEELGEGAGLSLTECMRSFDGLSSCGVNDTVFVYNAAARKGAAVAVGSGEGPSFIEFHRCLIHNSTTGWPIEDDPQGEGGGFALGGGTTTILEDCVVTDNYCGKKGAAVTLSSGNSWDEPGATIIMRNSTFVNNFAELDSAGAIYLGEYASARIEGDRNNFTGNICDIYGGVLAATTNTNVTVEGGWFKDNEAGEGGGVLWVKGELTITGGNFYENTASEKGGVVYASEESSVNISGGNFEGNKALDGGVVYVGEDAALSVEGGVFTENVARNGGGVFWTEDGGDIEITGGSFTENFADFGGFLYAEGDGITSCTGASVEGHEGIDGGAIYAVDDAVLEWACDLKENEALAGPAIYAREGVLVTLQGIIISDNTIARGSVVFIVSSEVYAYQVEFVDTSASPDLSAVQLDGDSIFVAEGTAFIGFQGETVVYSEGTLCLDDCDFRESSASALVYSEPASTTVVRNAILGDKNFKTAIQEYSEASEIPVNASLINVDLNCSESGSPCSPESSCLEGDLGVYCHCYRRNSTSEDICLNGHPEGLTLTIPTPPPMTFYPDLLEGDIVVSLDADGSRVSTSTSASMDTVETTSRQSSGAVAWNMSAMPHEHIAWAVFPSVGILLPGNNITVRVVSRPDPQFDGVTEVNFSTEGIGATRGNYSNVSFAGSSRAQAPSATEDSGGVGVAVQHGMEVTFYHCREGNFWNMTPSSDGDYATCKLCTDSAEGDTEGLNCEDPGASTRNLPIESGYWRASLDSIYIRECFNEDACNGGSDVESVDEYCSTGYEGPYCGVCSPGYGPGSSNSCHECTAEYKGIMFFVFTVAVVISVIVIILLGVYLVGGRVAVSKTVSTTRQSVGMLHRRGFGMLLRTEFGTRPNLGASASSVGDGSSGGSSKRHLADASTMGDSSPGRSRGGLAEREVSTVSAPGENTDDGREDQEGDKKVDGEENDGVDEVSVSASGSVSSSASASALRPAPESASAFLLVPELAPAPAEEEEKGGGLDNSFSRRIGPAPVEGRRRNTTAAVQSRGGGDVDGGSAGDAMHGSRRGRGLGPKEGERREEGPEEKEKTAATVIGEMLGRLPLSKLKIVIVVWQISNAFTEITEVPFPEVYDKFLAFIGIFSFDLSWILSAACISVGLDFYDELLIVTIGPVFLLGLLGVTFYLGASPVRSTRRDPSSATGISSSGVTSASTITGTSERKAVGHWGWTRGSGRGAGATSAVSAFSSGRFLLASSEGGGEGGWRLSRCRSNTTSTVDGSTMFASAGTAAAAVLETSTGDLNVTSAAAVNSAEGGAQSGAEEPPASPGPESRGLGDKRPSVRSIWKDGPGEDPNSEQNYLWWLFARHTTMTLIILYLVYSSVSTVIFQTFACEDLEDIDKIYLRADFRIECDTPKHTAYKIYAAVMIFVYPLGIPAAFWYFLARQKSSINPIIDEDEKDQRGADHVTREKERIRKDDSTIAPTSFLWSPYYPDRYYFEVFECIRRLLLTGLLVFVAPGTSGQVAYSCLFAFLSILGFEMLRPHTDRLDRMLYRTGSLVIFFTNFLALMIKAEVTDQNSTNATLYSLGLIIVNIFFVLSIWWNTWATIKAILSRRHVQGMMFGVDIVEEDKMDAVVAAMKESKRRGQSTAGGGQPTAGGEVKIEDLEAGPTWERDPSVVEEPVDISTSTRYNPGAGNDLIDESVIIPPSYLKSWAAGADEDSLSMSEPLRRRPQLRGRWSASRTWAVTPKEPTTAAPTATSVFESGPRSRGFPYGSIIPVPTRSARKPAQLPAAATAAGSEEDHPHA